MKKEIMILLVLGVLLVGTATSSFPLAQNAAFNLGAQEESIDKPYSASKDYPDWVDGSFVGAWGKGKEDILGYFKGLYGHKGRVSLSLGVWNTSDTGKTGGVRGIFGKGYMLGKIDLIGEKATAPLVGLYKASDDKFIARVMGVKGTPVVVAGHFKPFK